MPAAPDFVLQPGWTPLRAAELVGSVKNAELKRLLSSTPYDELSADVLAASSPFEPGPGPYPVYPVLLGTSDYPAALAALSSAPAVLFVRGSLDALALAIAVVGTRNATNLAAATVPPAVAAAKILGVPVTSGLARGTDALAHRAAITAGVLTCAVLATYPNSPTPTENASLAIEILEAGGALVAEVRSSNRAPALLQARNRIIAGLASTTIPAEASLGSGTMGTVAAALEAGRYLVVPVPRRSAWETPGAEALLALTARRPLARGDLRVTNALFDSLTSSDMVANAAPTSRTALTEMIVLAHRFSPFYHDPASPTQDEEPPTTL